MSHMVEGLGFVPGGSEARVPELVAPELLAPARDREAFLAAVAAGADAVYCGVTGGLNARRKAAGIAEEELGSLCAFAHERGVRVFVTANVVVKERELAGALEALRRYAEAGADAFIIQDWGLLVEARRLLPGVEIHVSTQANVHDARGVRLCEELGAERVTLSRELPLDEIAAIASSVRARAERLGTAPCELEVFAHGAICPSYSGICMLSSFLREGRSPNRGLCAQPCRLPFDLVGEDGVRLQPAERERPLCTHDNCAIGDVRALAQAGAGSLKLEGRMKPADYVYAVTSAWRRALGGDAAGAALGTADERVRRALGGDAAGAALGTANERVRWALKRSFNRGFTDCYLHGTSGNELMSYERSGNRGELVGRSVGFEPEPGFVPRDGQQLRGQTVVFLTAPVDEGDSLELRPPEDPTRFIVVEVPRDAVAGEELRVRTPRPLPVGCEARVTKSVALGRAAADAITAATEALERFEAQAGTEGCGAGGSGAAGSCVLSSRKAGSSQSASHKALPSQPGSRKALPKLRDSAIRASFAAPHEPASRKAPLIQPGNRKALPKLQGSAIRTSFAAPRGTASRKALPKIQNSAIRACFAAPAPAPAPTPLPAACTPDAAEVPAAAAQTPKPEICALTDRLEDVARLRSAGAGRVYLDVSAIAPTAANLEAVRSAGVIPVLDEVCREPDHARLDAWVSAGASVAVGNVSELALARECGALAETRSCIPVHNHAALVALGRMGARAAWLSPELSAAEVRELADGSQLPLGIAVYGRPRLMTCEHCVLQVAYACDRDHENCAYRWRRHWLVNIDGRRLPVRIDARGRSRIYLDEPIDLVCRARELVAAGVSRLLVDGAACDVEEVCEVIGRLAAELLGEGHDTAANATSPARSGTSVDGSSSPDRPVFEGLYAAGVL